MNTIFIGGSRHISRLSTEVKERLENVIKSGSLIIVGDANGADKAVQKYLLDASYKNVIVFCSGDKCRNNLGHWETRHIATSKKQKGFHFFAEKDRQMAHEADFGLMVWDGKSPGTALNVLRLVRAGKKAVLLNVPDRQALTFKNSADWDRFIGQCSHVLQMDLRERATQEEWMPLELPQQANFLDAPATIEPPTHVKSDEELAADINTALAIGDPASVVDALGNIARARGMSQVAKDAGLARESLYRSLGAGGNPEFATVLKVISSVGLRLTVEKVQ